MIQYKILLISFCLILLVPTMLFVCYFAFGLIQNYSITKMKNYFNNCGQGEPDVFLVSNTLKKVNGWNIITVIYSSLYYCFNCWSISLSVFSVIIASVSPNSKLIIASCVLTAMIMCCNLFLKCEKKWSVYRKVLGQARLMTNKFLIDIGNVKNPKELISKYVEDIIDLERGIPENELL